MPERVLQAMHQPCPNIYEGGLIELTHSLIPDLKHVVGTAGQAANLYCQWPRRLGSGCIERFGTGRYGSGAGNRDGFAKAGAKWPARLGLRWRHLILATKRRLIWPRSRPILPLISRGRIKAVMAVHVDTSTSVLNDIAALRRSLDAAGHGALLMVDCIASLGCDKFLMDEWGVDLMVTACQKGLMTPPGISFVFFSDKAAAARNAMTRVSSYWDWNARINPEYFYQYFCGTAPTQHLLGLREALDMILEEELDHVWARHEAIAQAVWAACEAWGKGGPLAMNIADPRFAQPRGDGAVNWGTQRAQFTPLDRASSRSDAGHRLEYGHR
jgi:alanine-glyoxylate transaminase/serine-glyoxylate transaminase/serine-pyruvate transaminase